MAKVSPMKVARDLGVRPQIVYGLIRKGRIPSYPGPNGKLQVDEAEAKTAIGTPHKRGRKPKEGGKSQGFATTPKVARGDLLSWGTKSGRRVAQVEEAGRLVVSGRTTDLVPVAFRTTSINDLVTSGTITVENPIQLLHMIQTQFELQGRTQWAGFMDELLENIRRFDDPGHPVEPDPDDSDIWVETGGGTG